MSSHTTQLSTRLPPHPAWPTVRVADSPVAPPRRMSATQRAALAFRTRTIADLSTPEPGNWKPSGNGQRQTDVTVWERALPRPTMSAAPTSLTEASTKFHEPTSQFRAAHYWPVAASSGGAFGPAQSSWPAAVLVVAACCCLDPLTCLMFMGGLTHRQLQPRRPPPTRDRRYPCGSEID